MILGSGLGTNTGGEILSDWAGRNLGRKVCVSLEFPRSQKPKILGSSPSIEDGVLRTEYRGWRLDLFIYDLFVTHSNYITR